MEERQQLQLVPEVSCFPDDESDYENYLGVGEQVLLRIIARKGIQLSLSNTTSDI